MGEVERTWKVGELARATGLTIRALHHYDDIGLLVPVRAESGHRLYSRSDVERLYRVLALRGVGMALDEIRAVLDDEGVGLLDTVRRHVATVEREIEQRRRLLDRLCDMLVTLERSREPTVDELIGAVEAMTVVEATIEDVVTRERWEAAWELQEPYVILLKESGGDRILPIWIGEAEAAALVLRRSGTTLPRPMGHDLMAALLGVVAARVTRVVIERLRDNTFFATVTVTSGGDPQEVDARPSDAVNLALRAGAPIQVASELMDTAGTSAWPDEHEADVEGKPPWTPVGERRSPPRADPVYTIDADSPELLRLAAAEARELGHDSVGEAHLLLGILASEDPTAAQILDRHGVGLVPQREAVASLAANAQSSPSTGVETRLTARAFHAMQRASIEARRRGTMDVMPTHVLLALVAGADATEVLGLGGVDLTALRGDARAELDRGAPSATGRRPSYW